MKIKFSELCAVFDEISSTKKRLEIQSILSEFIKRVIKLDPDSLTPALYLCLGRYAADHECRELGIGEGILVKIISESTGKSGVAIRKEYSKVGDLGTIAAKYRANQLFVFKRKELEIVEVHAKIKQISLLKDAKSQELKQRGVLSMLVNTIGSESMYLIRIIEGKLKIGLALKTVLISLGIATQSEKNKDDHVENVKSAYSCMPVFERIIPIIFNTPELLPSIGVTPGIPIKPMLAQPVKKITTAFSKFDGQRFTCEYKYDGERAQIHKKGESVIVYSRNSENLTERYPEFLDIITRIPKKQEDFIIDCEVVAFDTVENKILPFQILSTRKRKNVKVEDVKIQICIFAFDILFFDRKSVIDLSLRQRRSILVQNFNKIDFKFQFATFNDCESAEDIEALFNDAIKNNCEGLMLKNLDAGSEYHPSRRCYNWIKLKKDYLDGLGDSFDLVVLGCYYGRGKRTGLYGGFLMGSYNDEEEVYETVCKLGTGFDDTNLSIFYEKLSRLVVSEPFDTKFKEGVCPDVWIKPAVVWEVQAAGLSLSPIYSSGASSLDGKGISLRFPRFVRERTDKNTENATTSSQILGFYNKENNEILEEEDDY